uniref:Uncharacterized protein n=1 Tax=Glossina pallidipes TaxID=7398 RepID=A0A1A9Z2M1_GLOPL
MFFSSLESGISLGSFQFNILRSPGLDGRHELRGRLHKIKPDIEFEALTTSNSELNHNHYQHHHHHCHHPQRCHQLEQPLQQQYYQQLAQRQSHNQYQSKLSVGIECEQQQQQQHEVTPFETYQQERRITAEVSNKNSSITLNNHLNEHHWQHDNVKLDQSPTTTYNSQEVAALQSAATATASSNTLSSTSPSANNAELINPSSAVSDSTSPAIDIDNFSHVYNTDNPYEVPDSYTTAVAATTKHTSTPTNGKEYSFDTKNKESFCHHVYYNLDDSYQRPVLWEDISNSIQNIDPENVLILEQHSNSSQPQQLQQNFSDSTIDNVNVLVPQVKMETIDDTLPESLSASLINPLEIKKEILTKTTHNSESPHSQRFPQLPAPVSPRSGQINVYHYRNNQQQQQRLYQSHRHLHDTDIFILEQQQQQQQVNITVALHSNSNSPNQLNRCHSTASSHNSETNFSASTANSTNLLSFSPDNSTNNQLIYLQKQQQQQQQQQYRLLNQTLNDPTTTYDNNSHTLQVTALTINSSNLATDNNSKNLNNNISYNYPWHSSQVNVNARRKVKLQKSN